MRFGMIHRMTAGAFGTEQEIAAVKAITARRPAPCQMNHKRLKRRHQRREAKSSGQRKPRRQSGS
jgi:hypothetical protein